MAWSKGGITWEFPMPRRVREIQTGSIYHLISRFVAHEWFIQTYKERRQYLHLLGLALAASDWRCFAFAIMSNHIHLGMVAGSDALASWVREVHGPFAEAINERRERIGAVFARGPKSLRVNADGVAPLIAYIHRNPVRAGVAANACDSDWTSHRAYAGLDESPPWLDTERGLSLAGFANGHELDAWVNESKVERADVEPVRPIGRPRKRIAKGV